MCLKRERRAASGLSVFLDSNVFIVQGDKENQLSSGNKNRGAEIQFFQMFLLSGNDSAVYVKQMWFDPLNGLPAPPRGLIPHLQAHLAATSPSPPPCPSSSSSSSSFFHSLFFVSFNYKHMRTVFPPAAAKPTVCSGAAFPSELSTLARWET